MKTNRKVAGKEAGEVAVIVTVRIGVTKKGTLQRCEEGSIEIERPQDGAMFEGSDLL